MAARIIDANKIVDTALLLADKSSWQAVRLYQIAEHLEVDLIQVKKYFSDKEAISLAWFARADEAMLKETTKAPFKKMSTQRKIQRLIMAWLNALKKHQRVTKEMLRAKITSGYCHTPICFLHRIHQISQWILEAAEHSSAKSHSHTSHHQAIKEKAVACLLLSSLNYWCYDHSENHKNTEQHVHKRLEKMRQLNYFVEYWFCQPFRKLCKHQQHRRS